MFLNSNLQNERVEMRHTICSTCQNNTDHYFASVGLSYDQYIFQILSTQFFPSFFPGQSCVIPCGM